MSKNKIDYLTEDSINPSEQKFVCISFFSKNLVKQIIDNNNQSRSDNEKENYSIDNNILALKVRGSFSTFEEASIHAKNLQSVDEYHNVYVAEVGKWCPFMFDDNDKCVKTSEYANEELNTMMKQYMENQEKAKLFHEYRKNNLVKKNLDENLQLKKQTEEETKNLINNETDNLTKNQLKNKLESIESNIKIMEDKITEVQEHEKILIDKLKLNL
jgi:hypothetical protein